MSKDFSSIISNDVFDIRDVIERLEELNAEHDRLFDAANEVDASEEDNQAFIDWQNEEGGECSERANIITFMDEVKGCGGDEQYNGDWYAITFIRDSYFVEYARELLEDCGDIPKNLPSYIAIDWEETADNIQTDYTAVEIDGETYWYR